jgi:ankyrin repeat protein
VNSPSFFTRLCHPPIPSRAVVTLVVLACSSLAFGGEIHDASKAGDLGKVKLLLKDNPGLALSKDDKYALTPLHLAAFKGHKDVAELLLTSKAEVNAKDNLALTPLHMAALGGHTDVAVLLRHHGGTE